MSLRLRRGAGLAMSLCAAGLLAVTPARAGPPFVSDDPVPTDRGHWEVYNFAAGTHVNGATGGQVGFDLNYGGAKDLQLTSVIPFGYEGNGAAHLGLSNVELAAKYRFLHQAEGSWRPDVAVFPRLILATAGAAFHASRTNLFLPIWAGKDFGKWSVFGGGGYDINPGPGQRDFWLGGVAVSRAVTERLSLGVEVYHHTRDADDARAFTGVNLGALYRLTPHWSLIGSGGPGVQNTAHEGRYAFYTALKADY